MTNDVLNDLGTTDFDPASELETPEQVTAFLQACMDEAPDDAAFIAHALGVVARAQTRMAAIAGESGLSRESLYKALSGKRDPSFSTVLKVISALGLQIQFCLRKPALQKTHTPSVEPAIGHYTFVAGVTFAPMTSPVATRAVTTSHVLGRVDLYPSGQTAGSGANTEEFDAFDCLDELGRFALKGKDVVAGATSGHAAVLPGFAQLNSAYQH